MSKMLVLGMWVMLVAGMIPQRSMAAIAAYDVQVVLVVKGLDDAGLARLAKEVGKETSVTLEYSCASSGVLVLKYAGVASGERADAITMVRRTLSSAGLEKGMEVLHVFAEATGPGKC
ncbi:MAG TPA: hypothetical protein PKY96_10375 [Flavobacteriales bacterium]|nr:hypothetical protein [Flavobacteriales bacterium]